MNKLHRLARQNTSFGSFSFLKRKTSQGRTVFPFSSKDHGLLMKKEQLRLNRVVVFNDYDKKNANCDDVRRRDSVYPICTLLRPSPQSQNVAKGTELKWNGTQAIPYDFYSMQVVGAGFHPHPLNYTSNRNSVV